MHINWVLPFTREEKKLLRRTSPSPTLHKDQRQRSVIKRNSVVEKESGKGRGEERRQGNRARGEKKWIGGEEEEEEEEDEGRKKSDG